MSKVVDVAKRLSSVYTEDATPEELIARMEVLEQEHEQEQSEDFDCEGYGPTGHMDAMLAEQNKDFLELCVEVKREYGTDLHKIYREV